MEILLLKISVIFQFFLGFIFSIINLFFPFVLDEDIPYKISFFITEQYENKIFK
jgi:hypothetical protein